MKKGHRDDKSSDKTDDHHEISPIPPVKESTRQKLEAVSLGLGILGTTLVGIGMEMIKVPHTRILGIALFMFAWMLLGGAVCTLWISKVKAEDSEAEGPRKKGVVKVAPEIEAKPEVAPFQLKISDPNIIGASGFSLTVGKFLKCPHPEISEKNVGIVTLTIKNLGSPTIFDEWAIGIKRPGETVFEQTSIIRIPLSALDLRGANNVKLADTDDMERKTFHKPLNKGTGVSGILLFTPIRQFDMTNPIGITLSIQFSDARGKKYAILATIERPENTSAMFSGPGLNSKF